MSSVCTSKRVRGLEFLSREAVAVDLPALRPKISEPERIPRVDLVVRSWHEDGILLRMMLLSLAIYWPFNLFQSSVHIVLDDEAPETTEVCSMVLKEFGTWATCTGEPRPSWGTRTIFKRSKAARVHWSTFLSDLYTSEEADFVAILDSDTIFHSFGAEARFCP